MMKTRLTIAAVTLSLWFVTNGRTEAGLIVTVNDPGVQASTVAGVTTETFDGIKTGIYTSLNTAVGTITSSSGGQFAVTPADIYGGAGGTGNYLVVGKESGSALSTMLVTPGPQAYFGFWWSAADANNQLAFYSGSQEIGFFNTAFVLSALAGLPNSSQYFGNPNNGGDSGEPFLYLNFICTDTTTVTSVVFSNSGSLSSGFEADNFSISATAPSPPPGHIITGGVTTVPEPSSLAMLTIAGAIGLAVARARLIHWGHSGLVVREPKGKGA